MDEVKVTRKMLDEYRSNLKKIPMIEDELQEMLRGDNGIGVDTVLDYRKGYPRPQVISGFSWELYKKRLLELDKTRKKVEIVKRWVDNIEDVQTRTAIRLFYIDGKSWEQISEKLGLKGESTVRVCIRDVFFKKNGIK